MTYNKILLLCICCIFGAAALLTAGVIAYDRLAIVDHLFDFHLNEEACRQEAERSNDEKKSNERHTKDWCNDVRWSHDRGDYANDDRGTTGPPDRDK